MLRFPRNPDERGQTTAEYSVILAVIVTAAIVFTISVLSGKIADRFTAFAKYFT